jgi:hypothetical protein
MKEVLLPKLPKPNPDPMLILSEMLEKRSRLYQQGLELLHQPKL